MKRTLALILALVMIVGMIPMSVFADETTPTLTFTHDVTDVSALKAGDKFTVTATLTNNPGFAAFQFDLDWDNTVVQFDGFGMYEGRYGLEFDSEVTLPNEYDNQSGTIVIGVSDNITRNGYLFKANFTVLKEGDADITFKKEWPFYELKQADESPVTVTFDESALAELTITHTHDYTHSVVVTDPTCTEQGYTTRTCACGESIKDTYVSATGHTPSETEAGKCGVCGTAITVIPEGAPFIEMVTTDGETVTVTYEGTEPVYGMGPLYKVEVPLGTKQVNVTYPEDAVALTGFGYSANIMIGFANVTDDGYSATKKDGKVTVGLAMEKAAANGSPTIIKLINVPYGDEPRSVGFYDPNGIPTHFLAFTYKLGNGQHFAALPEGTGYTVTGSPIASDGYTFQVTIEDGYEATADFAVKVNGETVATQPGQVSVPSVTKDLDITVEGVAKIVNPDTDIFVTIDLTDYTGPVEGSLYYMTRTGESSEVTLTAGKKNSLALNASDNNGDGFWASIYSVNPLVIGYDINGTVYPIPNEYSSYNPGSGFSMNMDKDGYLQLINRSTTPSTFVVKPIVGTSESLGAAPDFAEPGTIDVTDITVVGADVIRSAWEGDTLNVILAEDTALDAPLKTMWTIYANNTKEGASQPCFNINGRLQTPGGTEATFTWVESMTLEDGTATKTAAFAVADMPWNPESALEFTPKTFTINFYVSGKEPAPTYTVSIDEEITGGTVTADPTSAEEGAEITLTVTPDDGYILKTLTVTDDSGEEVTVTDNKFTMPASNVTVSAVFEEEVSEPEYKSEYGITVMVGEEEMDLVANGTETCGMMQATKLNVTVPAGTTEVKFLNITDTVMYGQMYVYSGAHDWTEYASNVTEATISLTECGTSFCVSDSANAWYHVNITVEEPAPSYKSSYGITVMVGDEEMDLVANGTETCGVMQATKLNVTVPAGTTEVKFLNITDKVQWSQMYVYNGAHNWEEFASNVTEATISLTECGTSFCVSDSANAWYHVNITVEEPEIEPNPITDIEISHPNLVTDETTGTMTMAMVAGASETIDLSFTVQNADQEATQEIAWSSSAPEVATVENGKVTALKAGSTVITAKAVDPSGVAAAAEGEEVLAQFTLTVSDPTAGYTVTMGEDVENTVIGSTVSVPVTIGHTDTAVTQYSAYDMSFTYDPAVLKLATFGTEITDVKDDNGNSTGTIHVEHYGDKTDNGTALTLTFEAIATGETNVKVTAAKVDISESALTKDAPDASIRDNITLVSVTGYTINLPADFEGKTSILPGETYTFEAKDKNYTYDFTGSTMGGQSVTVTEIEDESGNGTGKYQIENVSGNIVISSEKTGKTFKVTLTGDGIAPAEGFTSGENAAQYNVDYKAQLAEIDKWNYSYTVTIGGKEYTDYTVKDGVITISGEDITGEITITVTRTAVTQDKHQVTIEGATGDVAGHDPEVENDQDYTFTVNKVVGYTYTVTATMDGQPVEVIDNGDGTYTIKNVTGVLKINVEKAYMMTVEVVEDYVKVEGKSMFLVLAEAAVDTGKVLSYDGTPMFYTTKYSQQTDGEEAAGKWAYLVFTETTLSEDEAKAEITLADVSESVIKVTLDQTFNVNESGITDGDSIGTVDINDAQLVYDMYNAVYENFENGATMQKFLKADVNSDRKVDVNDAMAIVDEIIKAK